MKFKLLFFTLILLLSISYVSAEMDNSTVENYTSKTDDADLLTTSDLSDTLEASTQSFSSLKNSIPRRGTLTLNSDYQFSKSMDKNYYDGIPLSRSITINGNGHSIDGQNTARIFSVTSSNLILKNIIFKNAYGDHGGAIYWKGGSGTIENCTFINCLSYDGGSIFALNSSLTFKDCTFTDNQALVSGGSIYGMYGTYSINNCKFINNKAKDGGAICADAYYSLTISDSQFTSNNASRYGGAVATLFNSTTTNTNNKFNNNKANTGNDYYNIPLSYILDTSNEINTLITHNPDNTTEFPSNYDLRQLGYLTPVKDQGSDGNCWAFAALSALESAILKSGGTVYDFSENNLKNLAAMYSDYGNDMEPNTGGHLWMSISYLTSWLGPINETTDPYFDNGNSYSDLFTPILHIQDVVIIKRNNYTDLNPIKQAIMQYGAVAVSLYSSEEYYTGANWYCPDEKGINHAITLVGWDDNYSKYNFKTTPPGNGAWIMRNSWGEKYGDGGYYYVSYYDKSLQLDDIFAFSFKNDIKYDNIYQHEFTRTTSFGWSTTNNIWFKNVYTSKKDEFIAGVSTWFDTALNYEIIIDVTHEGKTSTYTQSGHSDEGYYTIKLDKFIPVQTGDIFSITFCFKDYQWVPVSGDSLRNFSQPGNSYMSQDGKYWLDLHDYKKTGCIKGFTLNTIDSNINILDIGEVKVSDDFNITVNVTDQFNTPVNKGNVTFLINNTICYKYF